MSRPSILTLLVIISTALVGCGSQQPLSRVDLFKKDQASTNTPYGPIDLDSVQETWGGVSYKTKDGSTHNVTVSPAPDGSQQYGKPVRSDRLRWAA
jgi:uncharacterized protein YcfL